MGDISVKFKQTINRSKTNKDFDGYDTEIITTVSEFNRHLKDTPGYIPLNWIIIKAMVWTETGGPDEWSDKEKKYVANKRWNTQPMSMSKLDPGLTEFLNSKSKGTFDLIVPSIYRSQLSDERQILEKPVVNIRAGIAYLLLCFSKTTYKSVIDDSREYKYTVVSGDNYSKIKNKVGTTVTNLEDKNGKNRTLRKGDELIYQKAAMKWVITGWEPMSSASIKIKYNGNGCGDEIYADKLDYCIGVIKDKGR